MRAWRRGSGAPPGVEAVFAYAASLAFFALVSLLIADADHHLRVVVVAVLCLVAIVAAANFCGVVFALPLSLQVQVMRRDGALHLAVSDDGIGGADAARGSGLVGLADRVAALGGSISVQSPIGLGTRLVVELPLNGSASSG